MRRTVRIWVTGVVLICTLAAGLLMLYYSGPKPQDKAAAFEQQSQKPQALPHNAAGMMPAVKDGQERQDWVEAKLEEHKDEIDQRDMEDFRIITAKLDMDHVIGLLNNPNVQEGKAHLKDYLHSVLTKSEYGRAKELFFQYIYILFE